MRTYSRRKFVEAAIAGGAGITVLQGVSGAEKMNGVIPLIQEQPLKPGESTLRSHELPKQSRPDKDSIPPGFETMRPIRTMQKISVTVGQGEGDFQGNDDKILQAAVDYVSNLGGGTVNILPGTYTMYNSLFPRANIVIRGSGDKTILFKSPGISSKIIREADWFEYCVQVENPDGFTPGCGLALSTDDKNPRQVSLFTVTAVRGNVLYLDKLTEENFWMMDGARASTRFSIIHGWKVDDVIIEDLVLDGNMAENEHINDNFAAAVFMQYCNRWNFKNVTARNYNSDGFSFQVCDDIHFEECYSLNNADLGFHPGSGSQRPVFKRCVANGNSQGFFWCWGACDGIAEDCTASGNRRYGINFGHRDTDNIIRNCTIENNGEIGILFRKEVNEYRTGDRNIIENCVIRDNGGEGPGLGIDIQWKTSDITISDCKFENSNGGPQKTGIRISAEAQRITLESNSFTGSAVKVEKSDRPDN
jgi:parallel beta-helix repeat protein